MAASPPARRATPAPGAGSAMAPRPQQQAAQGGERRDRGDGSPVGGGGELQAALAGAVVEAPVRGPGPRHRLPQVPRPAARLRLLAELPLPGLARQVAVGEAGEETL